MIFACASELLLLEPSTPAQMQLLLLLLLLHLELRVGDLGSETSIGLASETRQCLRVGGQSTKRAGGEQILDILVNCSSVSAAVVHYL